MNEADWATFTPTEKAAAISYEYRQFQLAIASGTAVFYSAGEVSNATLASPLVTVTYACPIQWTNLPEGTWTRGGGWTNATAPMYQIYASQPGTYLGRFYRDGVQIKYWYSFSVGAGHSHEESWTDYDWKWWFEHPNYFNSGYHGAQQYSGGAWQLGPNQYCSSSAQP